MCCVRLDLCHRHLAVFFCNVWMKFIRSRDFSFNLLKVRRLIIEDLRQNQVGDPLKIFARLNPISLKKLKATMQVSLFRKSSSTMFYRRQAISFLLLIEFNSIELSKFHKNAEIKKKQSRFQFDARAARFETTNACFKLSTSKNSLILYLHVKIKCLC